MPSNQSYDESEIVALRAELAAAKAEAVQLRQDLARQSASWQSIRVRSPLTNVEFTEWRPHFEGHDLTRFWKAWCPCCKRPLDIACFGARVGEAEADKSEKMPMWSRRSLKACTWDGKPVERQANGSYAYVAALWGDVPGFALGALVLGKGLQRSGTTYDLVLLHTNDVPKHLLQLLAQIWTLRCVEYVHASVAKLVCNFYICSSTACAFFCSETRCHVFTSGMPELIVKIAPRVFPFRFHLPPPRPLFFVDGSRNSDFRPRSQRALTVFF
jgi:hypothetical protein